MHENNRFFLLLHVVETSINFIESNVNLTEFDKTGLENLAKSWQHPGEGNLHVKCRKNYRQEIFRTTNRDRLTSTC